VLWAPLTGVLLAIELTGSFILLLPMLAAWFAAMLGPTILRDSRPSYGGRRLENKRSNAQPAIRDRWKDILRRPLVNSNLLVDLKWTTGGRLQVIDSAPLLRGQPIAPEPAESIFRKSLKMRSFQVL
jgi:hypothetical protein